MGCLRASSGPFDCIQAERCLATSHLAGQRGLFNREWVGGVVGVQFLGDRDADLGEGVKDLGFPEARGVVFEGEAVVPFVYAQAAKTVGVGELAQPLELLVAERRVQFIGDFEKCHIGDYTSGTRRVTSGEKKMQGPRSR